ncbi:ATP-binding protein [Moraxella lacunata]|uniref:ATPase dynein-related AAA domain-containing protein n=1 Tax=Moraxella lacunata TaxID=477 RepID=A0A1V4H183_MORLA|nr:ATP-binding protein [Moraxella lacunata]OPH38440.1 hypothetical protein B5J94_03195 [Moraxella lacunata]
MSEINQFLNDDWEYELPARVVGFSRAGSALVRLFLDSIVAINDSMADEKDINLFIGKVQNLNKGDCVIIKMRKSVINYILLNGRLDGSNSANFIRKVDSKKEYQKLLKFSIIQEIDRDINARRDGLKRLAEDFNAILENINILKEIKDLEQANESLKQEKDKLLSFKQENQWLEKIKPYVVSNKNNISDNGNNVDKIITKTQSKPLFNKITKLLKDRFNLSDDFIYCYLLSLFTSLTQGRFLLLTGHIGTGKSSIIKETGKLLGGQTNMVAVRPAWLDASDLLGYFDPINNRYHSTDFVRFIKQENNDHINMILLDELNIARIENYGADILACFAEIGERNQEQNKIHLFNQDLQELIHTYQLFEELNDIQKQKYQHILDRIKQSSSIAIPDNVLICGTLNIDGSTENLSPKMIDRSFMLKFPDFDGQLGEIKEITEQVPLLISQMIDSVRKIDTISVQQWNDFYDKNIKSIKDSLIPISNRVAKDYLVFCQFAEFFGIDDEHKINALFFYARILPRLRIERLDDKNKGVLNSFKNNELFASFDREINSGNNGNFIDYQHICG